MTLLDGVILGLVQGLTEFIPVSSSGHLIVARDIFGIHGQDLAVDAVLQLATALAILVYFAKDLRNIFRDRKLILAIVLGLIPAVILGFLLEDKMETVFRSTTLVAWTLIAGALLMLFADKVDKGGKEVTPQRGFLIGLFQALALVPGISRSGATISGGMILGLKREDAARFSFLLAFPILFGSGLKKLLELESSTSLDTALFVGCVVAFSSGLFAIRFLLKFLRSNKLTPFVVYRILLAVLILVFI